MKWLIPIISLFLFIGCAECPKCTQTVVPIQPPSVITRACVFEAGTIKTNDDLVTEYIRLKTAFNQCRIEHQGLVEYVNMYNSIILNGYSQSEENSTVDVKN